MCVCVRDRDKRRETWFRNDCIGVPAICIIHDKVTKHGADQSRLSHPAFVVVGL